MSTLPATWTLLSKDQKLQRSSVCASTIGPNLYIFGGELKPRVPRDNDIHEIPLAPSSSIPNIQTHPSTTSGPSPRVGSASTTLNTTLYLFSGRGGEAMSPINESGSLWTYNPSSRAWSLLEPSNSPVPEPRSYHTMASDSHSTLYLHAGCPASGRLADFWSFHVETKEWKELSSAPGKPRGGASIAFAGGKVWRVNGFDGEREVGGKVDVYSPESDSWRSVDFEADGVQGPEPRSVGMLVPVKGKDGKTWLVTFFGEGQPSDLGHQGAGKMFRDGWAFGVEGEKWVKIEAQGEGVPEARGWFDADGVNLKGRNGAVVVGGLGENNERLDDAWVLTF